MMKKRLLTAGPQDRFLCRDEMWRAGPCHRISGLFTAVLAVFILLFSPALHAQEENTGALSPEVAEQLRNSQTEMFNIIQEERQSRQDSGQAHDAVRTLPFLEAEGAGKQTEGRGKASGADRIYRYTPPKDPYLQGAQMPKRLFGNVAGRKSISELSGNDGFSVFINDVPYTKSVRLSPRTPMSVRFKHGNPDIAQIRMLDSDNPKSKGKAYGLDKDYRILKHENAIKSGQPSRAVFAAVDKQGKIRDKISVQFVP